MGAPVIGARAATYALPESWETTLAWRYQKSDKHYVGSEYQEERTTEHSEVINTYHLADFTIKYNWTDRASISVSIPYLMAERSSPIRNEHREVIGRYTVQARGMGDIFVTGRYWMLEPCNAPDGNVSFGLGVKLPTGENAVMGTRYRYVDGETVGSVETVDQSIQPGDGGFGYLLEAQGFWNLWEQRIAAYASASYLINPENTNGVPTYRGRESESFMSVADQYLASAGFVGGIPAVEGLSARLGGRLEGVPVHDLVGSSDQFRRPGYAVSLEPGLGYAWEANSVSLSVPFALYRNRTRSVPDREDGRHGDAAFADWLLLLSWSHRF